MSNFTPTVTISLEEYEKMKKRLEKPLENVNPRAIELLKQFAELSGHPPHLTGGALRTLGYEAARFLGTLPHE